MNIIIDAYNLIKTVAGKSLVSSNEIDVYLGKLYRYASIKKHKLTVVFDGGISPWPTIDTRGLLVCIWVGVGVLADNYIRILFEKKNLFQLLVSSDRELVLVAKDYSIVSIDSNIFADFVHTALFEWTREKKQASVLPLLDNLDESFDQFMARISSELEYLPVKDSQRDMQIRESLNVNIDKKLYTFLKKL